MTIINSEIDRARMLVHEFRTDIEKIDHRLSTKHYHPYRNKKPWELFRGLSEKQLKRYEDIVQAHEEMET